MRTAAGILGLIAARHERRPARDLAALAQLFRRLGGCASGEAAQTEERIWSVWMHHPHRGAAAALDAATRDIAAQRYDIAEAWHKRAALYYLLGRDAECLHDIARTLELEPRHFAAMLHFAEILLGAGAAAEARYACAAALSLHPHLERAREVLSDKA
jgi:tetratricopeptide (TPR) repeat protein